MMEQSGRTAFTRVHLSSFSKNSEDGSDVPSVCCDAKNISGMSFIQRFLRTALLFVFPQTLPVLISTLKPPNCRVRGCTRFHVRALSSFDVLPPVGPLAMEFVTSKSERLLLFSSEGSSRVRSE